MSLNTYPYNPFPASTGKLDEAHNAELQTEVDQLKEDIGELQEDVETLETDKTDTAVIAPDFDAEAGVYAVGDLVMYQGKLYEFTSAHETAGDWDSTEVTEKTVADEVNSVKSGLTNYQVQNGLNLEVPDRKNLGVTIPSKTHNDVVFTSNADGTLSINGLASGYAYTDSIFTLKSGSYYISHGVQNLDSNVSLLLRNNTTDAYIVSASDTGVSFTLAEDTEVKFRCAVAQGYDADVDIYPMIRTTTITDPTFVPYIPSVESRIEAVESGLTNKVDRSVLGYIAYVTSGFLANDQSGSAQLINSPALYVIVTYADNDDYISMTLAGYQFWGQYGLKTIQSPIANISISAGDGNIVTITNNSDYNCYYAVYRLA